MSKKKNGENRKEDIENRLRVKFKSEIDQTQAKEKNDTRIDKKRNIVTNE